MHGAADERAPGSAPEPEMNWLRVIIGTQALLLGAGLPILAVYLTVKWIAEWRGVWRLAATVPIMLVGAWLVVLLATSPGSHTLWPFELAAVGVVGALYRVSFFLINTILIIFWRFSNFTESHWVKIVWEKNHFSTMTRH